MNLSVLAPKRLGQDDRRAPQILIGQVVAASIAFEQAARREIVGDLGPRQLPLPDQCD